MEFYDSKKIIEDFKNLFSKFVAVANEISVLHKSSSNHRNIIDSEETPGLDPGLIVKFNAPGNGKNVQKDFTDRPSNVIDELDRGISKINHEIDSKQKVDRGTISCADRGNVPHDTECSPNGINHKINSMQELNRSIFNCAGGVNIMDYSPNNINHENDSMQTMDHGSFINCAGGGNLTDFSQNDIIHENDSMQVVDHRSIINCAGGGNLMDYSPNGINHENDSMQNLDHGFIINCAGGRNVSRYMEYSPKCINQEKDSMKEPDRGSIFNCADGGNDIGFPSQRTADSNKGFSYSDFDQMEFVSEAEVATLEGYEVLMDLDLELENSMHVFDASNVNLPTNQLSSSAQQDITLQENSMHVFDASNVNLPTNQLPSSAQQEVQKYANSKALYENFMFGYDDVDTQDNPTLTTDNILSLPISLPRLLMNVNTSRRSCDNREMVVPTSNESKQEKRLFCIYCKKTVSKLHRHLTSVHKEKKEVKRLINLPKGSKQRLAGLAKLRKSGMFEHNGNPKYNNGRFLPSRRPNINRPRDATDFTTCAKCLGQYSKTYIRSHFQRCDVIEVDLKGERSVLVLGRIVEGRVHKDACDTLKNDIFPHMIEDDVVRLIKFDWLIIVYGNSLCDSNAEVFQHDGISGKLRLPGRLLTILKSIESGVTDFASLYRPKFYNSVIQAIRMVGQFDPVKKYYGSPSTSKAAVTLVRAVGVMLVAEYIKKEDVEGQTRTENFNKLFNSGVTTSVSKGVYRTQEKMKRDKREKLPSTEDIKLLSKYIKKQLKVSFVNLSKQFSFGAYLNLARMTIASLIVFNRRRTGETQNILTTDYDRREYLDDKWIATLSVEDQKLAKQYSRMKIRGKLGRTVPCLIKPDVDKCIQLLISHRKNAKISDVNEFLFALPTIADKRIRRINACNVLRKLSVLCGAKEPELLRGTKMRKHIASMCISMELSESAVSEVAEFMGHDDKVHYKFYRKMPIVREIVKMSKLLQTAQGGDEEDNGEISDDEEQDDPDGDYENWPHQDDRVDCAETVGASEEKNENWPDQDDRVGCVETAERNESNEAKIEDWPDQDDGVACVENAVRNEASEAKKKTTRTKWSSDEVAAVHKLFSSDLDNMKVPKLKAIDERRNEILKNRTSRQIKARLYNQMKKLPTDV